MCGILHVVGVRTLWFERSFASEYCRDFEPWEVKDEIHGCVRGAKRHKFLVLYFFISFFLRVRLFCANFYSSHDCVVCTVFHVEHQACSSPSDFAMPSPVKDEQHPPIIDQSILSSRFTPAVSQITERTENTMIRSDSMNPVTPVTPRTRQRHQPTWRPYYSQAAIRKERLEESLRKYGPPRSEPEPVPSPASSGLTDVSHTPSLNSVQPLHHEQTFSSLSSYRSTSTPFSGFLRAAYQDDEVYTQPFVNAVWDGDSIIPATDTSSPIPPTVQSLELGTPALTHPSTSSSKERKTICAGVSRMLDRAGNKVRKTAIPIRVGAATLPNKLKLKAAPWGKNRQELDLDILKSPSQQARTVRKVLSDSTFRPHERPSQQRADSGVLMSSQEAYVGDGEEREVLSMTSMEAVVGNRLRREDGREMPSRSRVPAVTSVSIDSGSQRAAKNCLSTLRTVHGNVQSSRSARSSDTIRRAPDSTADTPTPAPTSTNPISSTTLRRDSHHETPSPTSSRLSFQSPRPTQPPSSPSLNELLQTMTLNDIVDPSTALEIRHILQSIETDNSKPPLHVSRSETERETRARVQQHLRNVDENAARQVRARQESMRRLPRRTVSRSSRVRQTVRHYESLEGPSPYSGSVAYAPVTSSRLRHMQSVEYETGCSEAANLGTERVDERRLSRNEDFFHWDGSSLTGSLSSTRSTGPLRVVNGTPPMLVHQANVEDGSSESDREEELRRVRQGRAPESRERRR